MVSSDALIYETEQNPLPVRQEHALAILSKAKVMVKLSDESKDRASELAKSGIRPLDALHLAFSEAGGADYFCTCDDQLLRKSKTIEANLKTKVVSPFDLIQEMIE